jgi:hypothetical protein
MNNDSERIEEKLKALQKLRATLKAVTLLQKDNTTKAMELLSNFRATKPVLDPFLSRPNLVRIIAKYYN